MPATQTASRIIAPALSFALAGLTLAGLALSSGTAAAQTAAGQPGDPLFLTAPLRVLTAPVAGEQPIGGANAPARAGGDSAAPAPHTETGLIAYYGQRFAGRRTASGERFDPAAMTMAHRTLPFGTRVRVTNLSNDRSVVLRVNDRTGRAHDRIGDVSQGAAERLDMIRAGVVEARLEVLRVRTVR